VIRWDAPGYVVAFTTRDGGVSEGPYASLNLGRKTDDDPERTEENRRIACVALGADPAKLAHNYQVHGSRVVPAVPGRRSLDEADGLWTDEPNVPLFVMTADCVPIALVRADGTPALAVLHAGWKGLLAGVVANGVAALGAGGLRAAIGPAIGPCCYEVGEEVAAPYRDRFGDDVLHGRNLDLWTSTERALREAGVEDITRFDRCTSCEEEWFFSHRRDKGVTGRQGVIAYVAG
jgi:hypothetical protein